MLDTGRPSPFLRACRASEFWPRYLLSQRTAPDRSKQCSAPTKRCSIWLQEICHPGWTLQLKVLRPTHVNRSTSCTTVLLVSYLLGAKNANFLFVCAPLGHSQYLERCLVMSHVRVYYKSQGNQIQGR